MSYIFKSLVLSLVLVASAAGSWSEHRARAQDVDLNVIFRCHGPKPVDPKSCLAARELILNNCTVCHTFVPIVMQQFDAGAWQGLLDRHRPRVPQFSEAQIGLIQSYLTANFNPDHEPPELPEELLKTWTTY